MNAKKGSTLIFVTLLIALLAGAGAYVAVKYRHSASLQLSPPADETAGWKTYYDVVWGFSVQYPNGYVLDTGSIKPADQFVIGSLLQIRDPRYKSESEEGFLTVSVSVIRQPLEQNGEIHNNLRDFANHYYDLSSGGYSFRDTSVNGIKALAVYSKAFDGNSRSLLLFKDDFVYEIRASDFEPYVTILATFRFIQ